VKHKICIYTAIIGGYDSLKTHADCDGVDFIVFSDVPQENREDWEVRLMTRADVHPRLQAKEFKILPHVFLPEYDHTIWIDASMVITSANFADDVLSCLGPAGLACWRHPDRECIGLEVGASLGMLKYCGLPLAQQVAFYFAQGFPERWGLWACGLLVRRTDDEAVQSVMRDWYKENQAWTYQDQLSLPYCLWRARLRPIELPYGPYDNPWLSIQGHNADPWHA
jgi:hypothetical protein